MGAPHDALLDSLDNVCCGFAAFSQTSRTVVETRVILEGDDHRRRMAKLRAFVSLGVVDARVILEGSDHR